MILLQSFYMLQSQLYGAQRSRRRHFFKELIQSFSLWFSMEVRSARIIRRLLHLSQPIYIYMYIASPNWVQHVTIRWLRDRRFAPALKPISSSCFLKLPWCSPCSLCAPPCSLFAPSCSLSAPSCFLSALSCSLSAFLCFSSAPSCCLVAYSRYSALQL